MAKPAGLSIDPSGLLHIWLHGLRVAWSTCTAGLYPSLSTKMTTHTVPLLASGSLYNLKSIENFKEILFMYIISVSYYSIRN